MEINCAGPSHIVLCPSLALQRPVEINAKGVDLFPGRGKDGGYVGSSGVGSTGARGSDQSASFSSPLVRSEHGLDLLQQAYGGVSMSPGGVFGGSGCGLGDSCAGQGRSKGAKLQSRNRGEPPSFLEAARSGGNGHAKPMAYAKTTPVVSFGEEVLESVDFYQNCGLIC
ncbi:hypothetical protein KI387_002243, partial [Taxus chinensis]